MIVGRGDIAKMLQSTGVDHRDIVFFASGVSNSSCTDQKEFDREVKLLGKQDVWKHLVYFSSLSVYYATSAYANHKYAMETRIRKDFPKHTIVRLGNISWGTNPNTLINVLRDHGEECAIQDTVRYVVTPGMFDELMVRVVVERPEEANAWQERLSVGEIYERIKKGVL